MEYNNEEEEDSRVHRVLPRTYDEEEAGVELDSRVRKSWSISSNPSATGLRSHEESFSKTITKKSRMEETPPFPQIRASSPNTSFRRSFSPADAFKPATQVNSAEKRQAAVESFLSVQSEIDSFKGPRRVEQRPREQLLTGETKEEEEEEYS